MNKLLRIGIVMLIITFFISIESANTEMGELYEEWSLELRDPISYLEKEIERYPDNYRLKFVLGTLYFEVGVAKIDKRTKKFIQANLLMLEKAEKEFKEVLKIKKDESLAYYYLGHVAMQKDANIGQAMEYYKKAIESDKHNYRAYIKLHTLYLAERQYKDATLLLEKAIKNLKGDATIYHRLALTYLFVADYDKVIENAEKALSLGKNTETQLILASAYSLTEKYDKAKGELEDILNADPKNRTALLGISVVFSKTGKKEKAIEILKKALEYYPDDSEIKNKLNEIK